MNITAPSEVIHDWNCPDDDIDTEVGLLLAISAVQFAPKLPSGYAAPKSIVWVVKMSE